MRGHLVALREIGAASMNGPFCSVGGRAPPGDVKCGRHKIYGLTFLFSQEQAGLGRHLVAKYVTNAEPHGRPPYWGLSIEGRHKEYGPTFLFDRERARLGRHLVAKYVINAEPHKRPSYWGLPIEIEKHSLLRAGILLSAYLKTLHVIKAGQWHLKKRNTVSHFMDDWSKSDLSRSKTMEFQKFP